MKINILKSCVYKLSIALALSLLLTACVYAPAKFFNPQYSVGNVTGSICRGGPEDLLNLRVDGISFSIKLAKSNLNEWNEPLIREALNIQDKDLSENIKTSLYSVDVSLQIPEGKLVSFGSNELKVYSENNEEFSGYIMKLTSYDSKNVRDVKITEGLLGRTENRVNGIVYHRVYNGNYWIVMDEINQATIKEINLSINGQPHKIGPIKFIKSEGWYLFPINC